jgi:hypothetical protein
MRSSALRIVCSLLSCIGIGAATGWIAHSEQQIADHRALTRAFDLRARETSAALADVRAAQEAYVAMGQGADFWMAKVDTTIEGIGKALTDLRSSATTATTAAALDEAGENFAEFGGVDKRARDYIRSGTPYMASDVIFAEGGKTVARAARQVERARLAEHRAVDSFEGRRRRIEALAIVAAGGLAFLVILALTPRGRAQNEQRLAPPLRSPSSSGDHTSVTTLGELMLRQPDRSEAASDQTAPMRSLDRSNQATASALRAAAQLCTDLGRVNDPEELNTLLGRAADVLDASGLVLWLATAAGLELRPAVAHGYSQEALARMPPLARSANNAAAAAYRTGALQIVLSRPGASKGAIVAPVLSVNGCIGVLSAEVRDGGETSYTVQALAAIVAAQLAGMLSSPPATGEQRATGSGGM